MGVKNKVAILKPGRTGFGMTWEKLTHLIWCLKDKSLTVSANNSLNAIYIYF